MVDIAKILEGKVDEDAVVGGAGDSAPAGDVVSGGDTSVSDLLAPSGAISNDDVLGHCDHHKNGFMATGCFHIPKNVLKNYRELPSKKKKGHKNPYLKGMLMVTERDIDYYEVRAIRSLDDKDIINFINSHYNFPENKSAETIEVIVYWPKEEYYFIKVVLDNGKKRFVLANFNAASKEFIALDEESYSATEIMDKYIKNDTNSKIYLIYSVGALRYTDADIIGHLSTKDWIIDLDKIVAELENVPQTLLNSQIHVGQQFKDEYSKGHHIGDIESIDDNYPDICLNLKKTHKTSITSGSVEGCMKAKEFIEILSKLQKKYANKKNTIYVVEQLDLLSKQLGRKPQRYKIQGMNISKKTGIWLQI